MSGLAKLTRPKRTRRLGEPGDRTSVGDAGSALISGPGRRSATSRRRVDELPLLAARRCSRAAVEEVGDVGVLLGLGGVDLLHAGRRRASRRARRPAPRPGTRPARRCRRRTRSSAPGAAAAASAPAVELGEAGIDQRPGELAGAVGAEVEEDHGVVRPDPAGSRVADHDRLDELVGLAGLVARLYRGRPDRRPARRRRARSRRRPARPGPSAGRGPSRSSGRRPSRRRGMPSRIAGAAGGRVSRPSVNACTCTRSTPSRRGELDQRPQVADVAVDAAVGDEAEQVQRQPRAAAAGVDQHRVLEERAGGEVVRRCGRGPGAQRGRRRG